MPAAPSVELEGLTDTLRAFSGLESDLRKEANSELRTAAGECAADLARALKIAASASGVPVAPRVAGSIRVKRDRIPVVQIGGRTKVGTGKRGNAGALVWGSERGPASDPNRFAVAPSSSGYWIAPTVAAFSEGPALTTYKRAVVDIMRKWKLL